MALTDSEALTIAGILRPHEVRALKVLARGVGHFEPVGALPGLAQKMIDWMLERGFAERGWANEYTGTVGYRLTTDGTKVWSALPSRRAPERPHVRTIEPLVKRADIRIVKPIKK